jgi:hypothetical protein
VWRVRRTAGRRGIRQSRRRCCPSTHLKRPPAPPQAEEDRASLSPEEQREQLLARIKRDNAEVERCASAARDAQEQIKRLEAQLAAGQVRARAPPASASRTPASQPRAAGPAPLRTWAAASCAAPAVQTGPGGAEEAARREKYGELLAKERDLAAFTDGFPALRAAKGAEVAEAQAQVLGVLERVARLQALAACGLPSTGQLRELQDELDYKKMQLENSQVGRRGGQGVCVQGQQGARSKRPSTRCQPGACVQAQLRSGTAPSGGHGRLPGPQRGARTSQQGVLALLLPRPPQATAARLQEELEARRGELAKVEVLPGKVAGEMAGISGRLTALRQDLARVSDVPGAQRSAGGRGQQGVGGPGRA